MSKQPHDRPTSRPIVQFVVNLLGGGGYIMALLAWLWLAMLLSPLLMGSEIVNTLVPSQPEPATNSPLTLSLPEPVVIIVGVVVAIIMLGLTAYLLYKIPTSSAKKSSHYTAKSAAAIMPIITRHEKLPEAKQHAWNVRIIYYIKLAASIIPVLTIIVLTLFATGILPINPSICLVVATVLSGLAVIAFWLQALIATVAKLDYKKLF